MRWHYIVTASLIGWAYTQNDPWFAMQANTVKCRYNAVFGVQEIDRAIAVTAL